MIGFWVKTGIYLATIAAISWFFGAIGDSSAAWIALFLLLAGWLIYHLHYLRKAISWLEDFHLDKVPHGSGAWDLLYAKIYKLAKTGQQRREDLAETLKDIRSAMAAMPDGVVTLDEDNQIVFANDKAEEQLGINSDKDVGRNLINIVRHPDFVSYLNGNDWEKAAIIRGARAPDRVLQIQLIPYGTRQRLLMTRDVTQLDRLETMRRDFVANVSHELKTPLTVLSGFLETMRDLPLSDEQRSQYLGLMHTQAHRMQAIVEDLLVLSKLESTSTPAPEEPVRIAEVMDRICSDAKSMSRGEHQVTCISSQASSLLGAEDELISAFSNLASNAIRYTPSGGSVEISWSIDAQGCGVFSVKDTGPGIESQHLPRLTERFYRIDRSRSRETGGTGLGLAIVKHVATRHQAQLVIDSEVGQGSCFSMVFPRQRIV